MIPAAPHLRVAQRDGRPLALPKYYPPEDKYHKRPEQTWIKIPIPVFGLFRFHLVLPNIKSVHGNAVSRFGRMRGVLVLLISFFGFCFMVFAFVKRFGSPQKKWPGGDSPTLVFKREDLGKIWRWEVASGHHPSRRSIPQKLGLNSLPDNPALPPNPVAQSRFKTTTNGVGSRRTYLDIQSKPPSVAYPPRPVPGSIADFDIITHHCDFGEGKFVRDCLEVLRVGGGLDNGNRIRRGRMDDWKYIYVEDSTPAPASLSNGISQPKGIIRSEHEAYLDEGFTKSRHAAWESPLTLPPPEKYIPHSVRQSCEDDPRLFHMYWTGPFTDKPYLAVLSFLFTQNTGLHRAGEEGIDSCTPQLWIWINPGPAAELSESASSDLFKQLKGSPWAAPFLHPRFKNTIHFKMWNTVKQLDGISETRDDWRSKKTLFKSGPEGVVAVGSDVNNGLVNRTGSQSANEYDKLSVIMSDIARFILCHKFGGIYVDADTLFLRDWEEMWGWKGAFAYRWSFHDKYNTAVLRLRKGSALGHFLLRTSVKNGFDFHPFEITKYLKEARLDSLLTRLPDAMFDGAWLNMEGYQRERPPQPFFTAFEDFFVTPLVDSGAPLALGFPGFFSGAYSYHFHNCWWKPVDAGINRPDLGSNFRENGADVEEDLVEDRRDLDWSTVLKRTFEAYIRGEIPNMYGEYLVW
ncbi:glycosyltransferase family 32 protein [Mycena sanguinolenta]|nr:glycosyltransferase family 32 protein [Mycena sanguinolenta]